MIATGFGNRDATSTTSTSMVTFPRNDVSQIRVPAPRSAALRRCSRSREASSLAALSTDASGTRLRVIRSAATFPPNEDQLWPIALQLVAPALRRVGRGTQLTLDAFLLGPKRQ